MTGSLNPYLIAAFGLLSPLSVLAGSASGGEPDGTGNMSEIEADSLLLAMADSYALDDVVVTATRTPKSLKNVPLATRLITKEEIAKTDATNIQDLLTEELPGLEFGFAMSQETSLNMSGFGGSAVLFLLDGERMAGETMDNVDYNRLNLSDIAQVEIVKGASSPLYGANAVGGVVNLITREETAPWHLNVNGRYKSFGNEWRTGADLSFNTNKWNSNTSLQFTTSETVRLTDVFDTESKIQNIFGGTTINAKERLVFRATHRLKLIARGGYFTRTSNRANYDDHYHDYSGGLKGVWDLDSTQILEFSYSYDQYDKARYIGGVHTNGHDYSNRQHIMHALYSKILGKNNLTAGVDYIHDFLMTYQFADNTDHSQTSVDAFIQYDYNPLPWLNIIVSIRDDYFSESNQNAMTSRVATFFRLKPFSIRASYSGGFRPPTLKEMYMSFDMAGIQMIYGNPDLKPERSNNFNVALERNGYVGRSNLAGSYSMTVAGYCNYYDSRITTTDFPGTPDQEEGAKYTNEDGVKTIGIDANFSYKTRLGLGASISYNYLHTIGRTIDTQFTQPRPHSATWRLDYDHRFGKQYGFYAGISGRYLSKPVSRFQTDGEYTLWKLTIRQQISKGINVNIIVDNIFNYRPKVYYWNSAPTTGTTFSVGLSFEVNDLFKK